MSHDQRPTLKRTFDASPSNKLGIAFTILLHALIVLYLIRYVNQIHPPPVTKETTIYLAAPAIKSVVTPPPKLASASAKSPIPTKPAPPVAAEEHAVPLPKLTPRAEIVIANASPEPVNLTTIDIAPLTGSSGGTGIASGDGTGTGAGDKAKVGQGPLFAECTGSPDRAIVAEVFRVPRGTEMLPDFSKLKAVKTICLAQLDITAREFSAGFPGLENLVEWFGLDIRFTVQVPKAGAWDLTLVSDDGAILYIDNDEVINNDGHHSAIPKMASRNLTEGAHDFRVRYYQGPRYQLALVLGWKPAGEPKFGYIPRRFMERPHGLVAQ